LNLGSNFKYWKMNVNIQYLTDSKGNRTAVQIPYENWIELLEENQKLRQLLKLKKDLTEAFQEVENHQKGKKSLPSLDELINEL